jgi:hypothetical protein
MATRLVGRFKLDSGATVWLVHRVIEMPNFNDRTFRGAARYFSGHTKADLTGSNIRGLIFAEEADGSRVIFDMRMQPPATTGPDTL